MGGNLFNLGRLPRSEYSEIEAELRAYLDRKVGPDLYRIPRYWSLKPDFGDVDIILSRDAIAVDWETTKQEIVSDLGVERFTWTGVVLSTVYREFQVDYFVVDPAVLLPMYHFMSFNDLGNLLGRMYRPFNLKYGQDGLSYVFRRAAGNYRRDILVSRDWSEILGFLELDHDAWVHGFDELEPMFEWLIASPYFSASPYLDADSPMRKRSRQRPTIRRFIDYLEARGVTQDYEHPERDDYVSTVDGFFSGVDLVEEIRRERELEARAVEVAVRFNGRLVMELVPGLEGRALGELMRVFRERFDDDAILTMNPEAVAAEVRRLAP